MAKYALAVLLVAGCANTPVPVSEHRAVSPSVKPKGASGKASTRKPASYLPSRRPVLSRADRNLQRTPLWDRLARCESSGDWHANTGNGFYGGVPFTQSTWSSFGGVRFAPRADLASRAEQITVAERVLPAQGWNAWPTCSRAVGLQ